MENTMNNFVSRLLTLSGELNKCAEWMIKQNNLEAAVRVLPIAQTLALIATEMAAKEAEVHTRRSKISVVKKKPRR
jgi:hypothetical protein